MKKEQSFDGVMSTQEIKESQSYYGIRKAVENGSIVRLKNGVYASIDALTDIMIDIEKVVPRGALCLYSAWTLWADDTNTRGILRGRGETPQCRSAGFPTNHALLLGAEIL